MTWTEDCQRIIDETITTKPLDEVITSCVTQLAKAHVDAFACYTLGHSRLTDPRQDIDFHERLLCAAIEKLMGGSAMSGYDQRCPHCDAEIDCDAMWRNSDHQSTFRAVCQTCDGIVEITVEQQPVFCTKRPRCVWCHKPTDGTRDYCPPCQAELKRLRAKS